MNTTEDVVPTVRADRSRQRPTHVKRHRLVGLFHRHGARARGSPPPVPSLAIRRARLEGLLDGHPERQVLLVRGPAGAGKTVLVAQWVAAHNRPCAWFSIDATHNEPNRLARHMAEALERFSSDRAGVIVNPTKGQGAFDHTAVWDLLDTAAHQQPAGLTLVFDDLHRLRDRAVVRLVGHLVEHPPEAVRVVLVSRSKPRLGLERARLRGDLTEVTPAALRFDRSEIDMLAATWTDWRPDTAELELSTMGWAAGLRLEQLEAAAEHEPYAAPNEPDGITGAYIREELFDAEDEDLPAFVDVTCWLPVLTEPLRAAVAAQNGRPSTLTWSDLEVLPILPVASHPGTFRYPPILTRLLQHEYCRRDPRAAATARRRAAEACRHAGELVRSIDLFLQIGCVEEAADVCGILAARSESSLRAVDELLHGLPGVLPSSARWLTWRIRAAVAAGHVDEASRLVRQAASLGSGQSESRDLLIAQATVAEHVGNVTAMLAAADRLLAMSDDPRSGPASERQAQGWRVRALAWSDDLGGAKAALRTFEQAAVGSAPEVAIDLALARAWVAWLGGDGSGTAEVVAAARRESNAAGEHASELALLAGSAHRERNQTTKALRLIQRARTLTTTSSHHVLEALAASELARCHRAAGTLMDGLELVVSTRAAHPGLPIAVDGHVRGTEVLLRLDQGDVVGARAVLDEAPASPATQLLAARIALHQAPDEARALLETIDAQSPRQAVHKLLLYAQLPGIDQADAAAALVAAMSAGGHLGLVRTFLDEGPAVGRRLQDLALESPDLTLGRLASLVSQELALAPTRGAGRPVEQLTSRELAVLRMLPLRMSNREMAAQMYISVNTLKTHVRAIYRKLEVPHRSAAVRRAKALQLV